MWYISDPEEADIMLVGSDSRIDGIFVMIRKSGNSKKAPKTIFIRMLMSCSIRGKILTRSLRSLVIDQFSKDKFIYIFYITIIL